MGSSVEFGTVMLSSLSEETLGMLERARELPRESFADIEADTAEKIRKAQRDCTGRDYEEKYESIMDDYRLRIMLLLK